MENWAPAFAVEEVFGVRPEVLNDDRIGRALDAGAPELDGIVGSIGARLIAEFGIEVSRIHGDMTSISLFGAYASPAKGYIESRFGHPKDPARPAAAPGRRSAPKNREPTGGR